MQPGEKKTDAGAVAARTLSDRKKSILKAIVETHINLGEPVGSKYLTRYEHIAFSSATIRNEMAELEDMGYLEQPHTSAGRIPTGLGYRFYVDELMQQYRLTSEELSQLERLTRSKAAEVDRILDRATKLMSMLTNYTGLALRRTQTKPTVARFDVMYLGPRNFVLVMLTDSGVVRTRQLRLTSDVTRDDLEALATVLNDTVAGHEMDSITLPMILGMQSRLGANGRLIDPIIKAIYETVSEPDDGELMFDGVNNLLDYPEYSDISSVRDMLELFDDKEELLGMMTSQKADKTTVCIGSESPVEVMKGSSLIWRTIKTHDKVVGAIGVIGPRRMNYPKAVAMVDHMSAGIGRMIERGDLIEDKKEDKDGNAGK